MSEVKFNEVDVQKLNLQPGEVLIVTVRSDEADEASVNGLSKGLKNIFPNNKVVVFSVGASDGIDLTVARNMSQDSEVQQRPGCGPTPADYCDNCSCGKKEAYEGG